MKPNWQFKMAIFENETSQRDLAKKSGIHESVVSMAIRGKYNLAPGQKAKIAKILNRPQRQIFPAN